MSWSSLTNKVILTDNCSSRNGRQIDTITIHHMAGNLSIETCGQVFQNVEASANYGIGSDGRVGCYVEEENRAYVQVRPYADYFLTEMGKYFEIVIFTAAAEDYADIVLNELDKNKSIDYK